MPAASITRRIDAAVPPGARRAMLVRVAGAGIAVMLALLAVINPILGISAALVLLLTAGFTQSATFGVCAFVFFTYFDIVTSYTGNAAMSPIKVTGGALIVLALLTLVSTSRHRARERDRTLDSPSWSRHPVLLASLVGFVGVGVISVSWAANVEQVRTLAERLVTDVLVFLAIGVFLLRSSQLRAVSISALIAGVVSTFVGVAMGNEAFGRMLGTFDDPNEYAAGMIVSIALGYGALGAARTATGRAACMFGMLVCAYGVIGSQSRGGLIAMLVAAIVIVLSSRGRERARLMGVTFLLLAAAVIVLVATPTGQQTLSRITDGDSSGRDDLWQIAYAMYADEPVHGVGLGNYPAVASHYITRDIDHTELINNSAPRTTHNAYLEVAAELGTIGLVTFGTFVFGSLLLAARGLRRARRLGDPVTVQLGRGVLAGTCGLLASAIFLSGQYGELLWVMLACCVAYHAIVVRRERIQAALATAHEVAANLPVDELQLELDAELASIAIEEFASEPQQR
jgi:O-antigen ligase